MNKNIKEQNTLPDLQVVPLEDPLLNFKKSGFDTDFDSECYKEIGKVLDFSPQILVIGRGPSLKSVTNNLKVLDAKVKAISNIKALPKLFGPTLKAIVVVESKGLRFIVKECKKLIKNWSLEDVPIFAIVSDTKGSWSERKLYQTGVQAVFEWPREKNELPILISKIIELNNITISKESEDSALKLAVRTRLLADKKHFNPKALAIYVYNGIVMLDGVVRSFTRLKTIKESIRSMPGVRGVLARSVRLKIHDMEDIKAIKKRGSDLSDQKFLDYTAMKKIKEFIRKSAEVSSPESIKVSVFYGLAILNGMVENLTALKKIENFAKSLDGILNVQNKIQIRT